MADATDADALAEMAARTKAVVSTVGPYALHGSDLVAAAVAAGTDYCDLTGEPQWMHRVSPIGETSAFSPRASQAAMMGS